MHANDYTVLLGYLMRAEIELREVPGLVGDGAMQTALSCLVEAGLCVDKARAMLAEPHDADT